MKTLLLASATSLFLAAPLAAEEAVPTPPDPSEGFSMMGEGARMLFEGLLAELEPSLAELHDLAGQLGPALAELFSKVDAITHYEAPEFLPNGDIIIRRKPDAPLWVPPPTDPIDI